MMPSLEYYPRWRRRVRAACLAARDRARGPFVATACFAARERWARATSRRGAPRLLRQRRARRRAPRLTLQRAFRRACAPPGRGAWRPAALADLVRAFGGAARPGAGAPGRRWLQRHTGAPRLGQPDGDRLLRRARAVFALPDVLHLLADELTRGGGRCLPRAKVALRLFQRRLTWHEENLPTLPMQTSPATRAGARPMAVDLFEDVVRAVSGGVERLARDLGARSWRRLPASPAGTTPTSRCSRCRSRSCSSASALARPRPPSRAAPPIVLARRPSAVACIASLRAWCAPNRPSRGTMSERPDETSSASISVCSSSSTGRLLVRSERVRFPPGPRSFLMRRFLRCGAHRSILMVRFALVKPSRARGGPNGDVQGR